MLHILIPVDYIKNNCWNATPNEAIDENLTIKEIRSGMSTIDKLNVRDF